MSAVAGDLAGAVTLLLAGLACLLLALLRYLPRIRWHDQGELVSGRVTSMAPATEADGPAGQRRAVIEYATVDGQRMRLHARRPSRLRIGDAVTVWYDPAHPDTASTTTRDQLVSRFQAALLAAGAGITAGGLVLWCLLAPPAG